MGPAAVEPSDERPTAGPARGRGPLLAWLAFVVILAGALLSAVVGAVLVLGWTALSRNPWRDLGFVRPRRWWLTIVGAIVAGTAFKLAMKAVVMPLLGAPPMNAAYQFLAGNALEFHRMVLVLFGAGFSEEVLFRGYLFERLGRLLGRGRVATVAIVIVTSLLFAAAHYQGQGLPGVEQALVTGLVFATLYARTRALPFIMILHTAFDLTAAYLIYHRLETAVAHWVFR